jgi:uncharacterized protein with PIN domain
MIDCSLTIIGVSTFKKQGSAKFLVDQMLGELARWLRLLGYDTYYSKDLCDEELIQNSIADRRVLLTSDQELHRRALKMGASSFLLGPGRLVEKLAALAKTYDLDLNINPASSRCPICNGGLRETSDVAELSVGVPATVQERQQKFWVCTNCNKAYWVGGHWKNITKTINDIKNLLEGQPSATSQHQPS